MYGYIYLTTNHVNGKCYIGRKVSNEFLGTKYLGSGHHLKNAIELYGKENFTVKLLDECETYTQLIIHEWLFIKYSNAVDNEMFYNHSPGGLHEGWVPGEANIAKTAYMKAINAEKHRGKHYSQDTVTKREQHQLNLYGVKYAIQLPEFQDKRRETSLLKFGVDNYSKTDAFKIAQSKRTSEYNLTKKDYQKLSEDAKGKKMMYKDGVQTWVYLHKQAEYLDNGWQFGSCKKRNKKQCKL